MKSVNPFSITSLADELDYFLAGCSRWFEANSHHVVRGCAGIAVTLILSLLLLFLLRDAVPALISRKKPSAAETIRATAFPFSLLILWAGLSFSADLTASTWHDELNYDIRSGYQLVLVRSGGSWRAAGQANFGE